MIKKIMLLLLIIILQKISLLVDIDSMSFIQIFYLLTSKVIIILVIVRNDFIELASLIDSCLIF